MCRPTFDALDRSWGLFVRSSDAVAALDRWRGDPELAAPDLDALVQGIWEAPRDVADRACAALARRAPDDPEATRVLLQALRPGLRSLGRRLALGGSFEDVDHELLALAWERIRTYPIDRRPATIAGNILLDVRKRYVRSVLDPAGRSVALEDVPLNRWPAHPSAEHEAVEAELPGMRRVHDQLADAVDRGTISASSAHLLWRTRIQQEPEEEIANELGIGLRTLQRRRQRAERRLALAS